MNEKIRCYHCDTHMITASARSGNLDLSSRKITCPVCEKADKYIVPKFPIITFNILTGIY